MSDSTSSLCSTNRDVVASELDETNINVEMARTIDLSSQGQSALTIAFATATAAKSKVKNFEITIVNSKRLGILIGENKDNPQLKNRLFVSKIINKTKAKLFNIGDIIESVNDKSILNDVDIRAAVQRARYN